LSAGVDFPEYKRQVEMAMKAGASGILGGRAFWKEYFLQEGPQARDQFARGECLSRVRQIDEIVKAHAKPWFARYRLTPAAVQSMRATEHWHFRYGGGHAGAHGGPATATEGEVYYAFPDHPEAPARALAGASGWWCSLRPVLLRAGSLLARRAAPTARSVPWS